MTEFKLTCCALAGATLGALVLIIPWVLVRLLILVAVIFLPAIIGALIANRRAVMEG